MEAIYLARRHFLLRCFILSFIVLGTSWERLRAEEDNPGVQEAGGETLIARFSDGPYAMTTTRNYEGPVTVTVLGIGQASATQYSDAFYILTDHAGNPITPYHPTEEYNWVLWINGQHAEDLIEGRQVPAYRSDNVYTFEINAPGGPLTFGVGDVYTADNTGSYAVIVDAGGRCEIPYFSQLDPRWVNHPLRTDGACDASCGTIGSCGCTLTAAAMNFAYLGADIDPASLSDCMGTSACPFSWLKGASCSQGQASAPLSTGFSWGRLDQELNENKRPVILGMYRDSNRNGIMDWGELTHWVLATSGNGSDPANYLVHDPGTLRGADTVLRSYTRLGYVPYRLVTYTGQTACAEAAVAQTPAGTSVAPGLSSSSTAPMTETVSGSITRYHLNETTIVVQLAASSPAGAVEEMMVWSDSSPTQEWQPFQDLMWLPWRPGDELHAHFRDVYGNESEVYTQLLAPGTSPPPTIAPLLYLPLIRSE